MGFQGLNIVTGNSFVKVASTGISISLSGLSVQVLDNSGNKIDGVSVLIEDAENLLESVTKKSVDGILQISEEYSGNLRFTISNPIYYDAVFETSYDGLGRYSIVLIPARYYRIRAINGGVKSDWIYTKAIIQ